VNAQIAGADSRDVPALVALLGELFAHERDFAPDPDKQARGLRLILALPEQGRLFVARDAGKTVGMANALFTVSTAEGGPVVLLEDVIVAPFHRGQGLGRLLVEHVIAWAHERGFLRVTLLTEADNHDAQRFYERLGFGRSGMVVYRLKLDGAKCSRNPDLELKAAFPRILGLFSFSNCS
jgi:GNAT superfamily N-acetyltransferase